MEVTKLKIRFCHSTQLVVNLKLEQAILYTKKLCILILISASTALRLMNGKACSSANNTPIAFANSEHFPHSKSLRLFL